MNLMQQLTEKLAESKRFIRFVALHFMEDGCTYRASALTFATLLAIVPLMSLGFSILSTFPAFQDLSASIQNFIFLNFVPTTGKIIQNYLQLFTIQASKLSVIGIVFLFIVALLVMYTVEDSMNKIWRVTESRQGVLAFLSYWGVVSLTPVLLGLSLAASSYLMSIPFLLDHTVPTLLNFMPSLLSLLGFTFLYIFVPNRPVKFLHGLCGGIVASLLFEIAKQGFAFYLSHYNIYELLYGAFATVPIFFIWIYWVWIITLLGAEIAYALSVHHQRRVGQRLDGFSHALLWLYKLYLAQLEGKGLTMAELINASTHAYAVDTDKMLKQLTNLFLIQHTTNGRYILSCNLSHLTLYDLSQLLPYHLPRLEASDASFITPRFHTLIQKADTGLKETLAMSLETLFVS